MTRSTGQVFWAMRLHERSHLRQCQEEHLHRHRYLRYQAQLDRQRRLPSQGQLVQARPETMADGPA